MSIYRLSNVLAPRSVALVGASPRRGSLGAAILNNIRSAGFAGEIGIVNPRYGEIDGVKAASHIDKLPFVGEFLLTPPGAWNEERPFVTTDRAGRVTYIPRYDPTPTDDPKRNTRAEERKASFQAKWNPAVLAIAWRCFLGWRSASDRGIAGCCPTARPGIACGSSRTRSAVASYAADRSQLPRHHDAGHQA